MPAITLPTQLEAMVYDLRFAWRGLRRDRACTLTAIATLTLAIALNVTVFAVMDTMLLRGLPLAQRPDRLVYIQERRAAGGGLISYADFADWRVEAKSFEGLAFVAESGISFKDGDGRPIDMSAFALSTNTFGLLGVHPMLGRDFAPAESQQAFEIEGKPVSPDGREPVGFFGIGSNYFSVVSAAAISGREFNDGDRQGSLPAALVNQSFAARFFPGENPIGKRLRSAVRNRPSDWLTVVGVVPNIMQDDATRQQFKPLVYVPLSQRPPARAYFLIRTRMSAAFAGTVRAEVQNIDSDVSLDELTTLKAHMGFDRDSMDALHSELGKYATVAPIFAGIALLLAAVGLYAVIAHSVGRRTREIGVRMAIGARAENIRAMIFREGMLPVAAGTLLGLAASLAVNRVLQSQLVGVSPYDPATIVSAPAILALVALLACGIPARRAMNVDPAIALRHD